MAKALHCAETTRHPKGAFLYKDQHIVQVQSQVYGILTSILDEMRSLKYFLIIRLYTPISIT